MLDAASVLRYSTYIATQHVHTMPNTKLPCYLRVQDFVDAYIGPFPTERAACEHYLWTKEVRGDGATIKGISTDLPPADEMLITPEQDKAFVSELGTAK